MCACRRTRCAVLSCLAFAAILGLGRAAVAGPAPGPFDLLAPSNGATGVSLTPTLDWQDATDAATYTILIDDDADLLSPFVNDATLTVSEYTVGAGVLAAGTTYYWQVTAVNSPQETPATNNPFSFTTLPLPGSFNLLTPSNGATGQSLTPTLDWEDATDAAMSSEYTVGAAVLAEGVTYYWRVTAVNTSGPTPATNNDFGFTTLPLPGSFNLLTPPQTRPPTSPSRRRSTGRTRLVR